MNVADNVEQPADPASYSVDWEHAHGEAGPALGPVDDLAASGDAPVLAPVGPSADAAASSAGGLYSFSSDHLHRDYSDRAACDDVLHSQVKERSFLAREARSEPRGKAGDV